MKSKFRIILLCFVIVSIAGLLGAAYLKYRVRKELPVSVESVEFAAKGGVKAEKVRYTGTRDGRTEWELEAEAAEYSEADEMTRLDTVKVIFYSTSGVDYRIKSSKGSYSSGDGSITASGGVTVVSSDGLSLKTERLSYSEKKREIATEEAVFIENERMRIEGEGLRIDVDKERFDLLRNVRAELRDVAS